MAKRPLIRFHRNCGKRSRVCTDWSWHQRGKRAANISRQQWIMGWVPGRNGCDTRRVGCESRNWYGNSIRSVEERHRQASRIQRTMRWPSWRNRSAIVFSCALRTWMICTNGPARRTWFTCTESFSGLDARRIVALQPLRTVTVTIPCAKFRCALADRDLRPHIVWFGEVPLEMTRIQQEIDRCSILLVVGTSGAVHPAASFVHWAKARRGTPARTYYVGPEEPLNAGAFTRVIFGRAGERLPRLFKPY